MQCLRWGAWCPFQEPDAWKGGGEVRLVLQGGRGAAGGGGDEGGSLPNPCGVMVYCAQTAARTPSSTPIAAADDAQVAAAATSNQQQQEQQAEHEEKQKNRSLKEKRNKHKSKTVLGRMFP